MECTASISKGKTAERHNTRECYDARNCPENVDLGRSGENVVLVNRSLEEVYADLFGKAAADYSAKQVAKGHPERAVPDYLAKVRADKQLKPMYEFVVQVGNRDNAPDVETCVRVLTRWLAQFNERFGQQFAVKQAIIHLDESTPHLHIELVPVAKSKRGLAVQNSLSKAIKQAGFEDYKSMLPAWDDILTNEMERAGIARVAGSEERSRGHMTVEQYKDFKAAEGLLSAQRDEIQGNRKTIFEQQAAIDAAAGRLEGLQQETGSTEREIEGLEREISEAVERRGSGIGVGRAGAVALARESAGVASRLDSECQAAVGGAWKGQGIPASSASRDRSESAGARAKQARTAIDALRERFNRCREVFVGLARKVMSWGIFSPANRPLAEEVAPKYEPPRLADVLAQAQAAADAWNREHARPSRRTGRDWSR